MDWINPGVVLQVLQGLGLAIMGIYQWHDRQERATRAHIDALAAETDRRLDELLPRVASVEERTRHLPTLADLPCRTCETRVTRVEEAQRLGVSLTDIAHLNSRTDSLTGTVADLRGTVAELRGTMEEARRTLALIHQHLMSEHHP